MVCKARAWNASTEILQKKAEIIKEVNAGESDTLTYKVQGWRQSNGELWRVNSVIGFKDPMLGPFENASWITTQITYSLSSSGTASVMTLSTKSRFNLFSEPDAKKIRIEENSDIKKDSGKT